MEKQSKIESIISRNLVSVTSQTLAATAAKVLENSNLSLIPVIDDERLVGIISEGSAQKLRNSKGKVGPLMEKPLFVEKSKSIDYTIKYITEHAIGRVPVVESQIGMHCIGIVSASQLLKAKKSMRED